MTDVKAVRRRLGLSQQKLADALGKSLRWVKYIEAGELEIPRWLTLALAALEPETSDTYRIAAEAAGRSDDTVERAGRRIRDKGFSVQRLAQAQIAVWNTASKNRVTLRELNAAALDEISQ